MTPQNGVVATPASVTLRLLI